MYIAFVIWIILLTVIATASNTNKVLKQINKILVIVIAMAILFAILSTAFQMCLQM